MDPGIKKKNLLKFQFKFSIVNIFKPTISTNFPPLIALFSDDRYPNPASLARIISSAGNMPLQYRKQSIYNHLKRDEKTYEHASNACVNFIIVWVKSVTNSTLFCCERELCCNFPLFGGIQLLFCIF